MGAAVTDGIARSYCPGCDMPHSPDGCCHNPTCSDPEPSPRAAAPAKPDNPPAFPFPAEYGHPAATGGMDLLDHFAGRALASIAGRVLQNAPDEAPSEFVVQQIARVSWDIADAMLAERAARKARP